MKISELPENIREIALQRQRDCKADWANKNTDDLSKAFEWSLTPEQHQYWEEIHYKPAPKPKEITTFKFC